MNDYIDISVLKGQQIVINKFAEFYLIEELEQIKFDNIVIPDSEKETTTIYEKSFETDHKLQILDIILADTRYIDIRMSKNKSIQL